VHTYSQLKFRVVDVGASLEIVWRRVINVKESVRDLNVGSHTIYFEVYLNSVPELIFGACLKSGQENLEARLDDYDQNGRLHYIFGMKLF
jgi:hypothetical protein